jgi:hypothetical protein
MNTEPRGFEPLPIPGVSREFLRGVFVGALIMIPVWTGLFLLFEWVVT